jgi:hypothetical protein
LAAAPAGNARDSGTSFRTNEEIEICGQAGVFQYVPGFSLTAPSSSFRPGDSQNNRVRSQIPTKGGNPAEETCLRAFLLIDHEDPRQRSPDVRAGEDRRRLFLQSMAEKVLPLSGRQRLAEHEKVLRG